VLSGLCQTRVIPHRDTSSDDLRVVGLAVDLLQCRGSQALRFPEDRLRKHRVRTLVEIMSATCAFQIWSLGNLLMREEAGPKEASRGHVCLLLPSAGFPCLLRDRRGDSSRHYAGGTISLGYNP
jgi:hypothetical protein